MPDPVLLISNLGARFELAADTLRCFEKGKETAISLPDVVRVKAMMLGGGGVLELTTADGRKVVVVSSREIGRGTKRLKEPARSEYRTFAAELHRRLATSGKVDFISGWIFKKRYDPLALPENILP